MTKAELQEKLAAGEILENLFPLSHGQDGMIYKAEGFSPGDEIIYIPDLPVHDLFFSRPAVDQDEIEDILSLCSTGNDFLLECGGDKEKAKELFNYCDWQSPSAALDEIDPDDDEPDLGPPLDKDAFWKLISDAKERFHQDGNAAVSWMVGQLTEMGVQSAVDFYEIQSAYMHLAAKYGLWTAASIPMKYCSDDGFIDFRAWLIAQGKEVYMKALENPDSLATLDISDESVLESFNYVGNAAYEKLTGQDLYDRPAEQWTDRTAELEKDIVYGEGIGYPYEWDEVEAYLPKLCAKYLTPEALEYNKTHFTKWNQTNPDVIAARLRGKSSAQNVNRPENEPLTPREELLQRVEDSYRNYRESLAHCSTLKLIDLAWEIAKTDAAYSYMKKANFDKSELAYLLQYQDPLRVITDNWADPLEFSDDMDEIVDDLADREDILDYLRTDDIPAREASEKLPDEVKGEPAPVQAGAPPADASIGQDTGSPSDLDGLVEALFERVQASLQGYYGQWSEMKPMELVENSREITAIRDIHSYLLDAPDLSQEEIGLLLRHENSIKAVADKWRERMEATDDLPFAVNDVLRRMDKGRDSSKTQEKPSVMKKIRVKASKLQKPGREKHPRSVKKDKGER